MKTFNDGSSHVEKLKRMGYEIELREKQLYILNQRKGGYGYPFKVNLDGGELRIEFDPKQTPDVVICAIIELVKPKPNGSFFYTHIGLKKEDKHELLEKAGWKKNEFDDWEYVYDVKLKNKKEIIAHWIATQIQCKHDEHVFVWRENGNTFQYFQESVKLPIKYQDNQFYCLDKMIQTEEDVERLMDEIIKKTEKKTRLKELYTPSMTYTKKYLKTQYFSTKKMDSIIRHLREMYTVDELELICATGLKNKHVLEYIERDVYESDILNIRVIEKDKMVQIEPL